MYETLLQISFEDPDILDPEVYSELVNKACCYFPHRAFGKPHHLM